MEFKELLSARRSVRGYASAPGHDDIVKILKEAQQAPSWKNRQPARCYVAETPETLEDLRAAALPSFNQNSSAGAALIVTAFVRNQSGFENGEPVNEAGNGWGAYDLGLHDAYLILAAKDAGYDTLIMGIRDADAIREKLGIPEEESILSVIAIGKRHAEPADKPRKDLGEVVKFF